MRPIPEYAWARLKAFLEEERSGEIRFTVLRGEIVFARFEPVTPLTPARKTLSEVHVRDIHNGQ